MRIALVLLLLCSCTNKNQTTLLISKKTVLTCPNSNEPVAVAGRDFFIGDRLYLIDFIGIKQPIGGPIGYLCMTKEDSGDWISNVKYKSGYAYLTEQSKFHTKDGWVP